MKVWYDACTGKHTRYGAIIGKRLRADGHKFIFTTREHPDTIPLAKALGENPIVVGKYNPSTLTSRLQESAERIIAFAKLFKDNKPDIAIAHQSVELCRVAFGLGIPIILTADTPHAQAVNMLTIPFAYTVVVSEALPESFTNQYCAQNVVRFKGVDEVAWIKDYQIPRRSKQKEPLIVLRQVETKAAYAKGKHDTARTLAEQLEDLGNVNLLQRYNTEGATYGGKSSFEDSVALVANADLVVSYGGTISREAALMGIPSIAISEMADTPVNTYLSKKGFPFFITTEEGVMDLANKHLGKRSNVTAKLDALENPVDVIAKIAENLKTAS
jgi:predicted glycosyltransferase